MDDTERSALETAAGGQLENSTPQTFQISIRIIGAKQLAGIDLDPFVRVVVGREEKQTKTKRSTATPTFEEDFFFDFNLPSAVFFDQVIKLQVYSAARLFRRRKLVGEFQIDVATVYHQPGHYFFEKWAMLITPKDPLAAPSGYVMCSIVITRPQEVPKLPHSRRDVMEDDDIENELLIPDTFAGWPGDRDPAYYIVTIYKAEDLPNTAGTGITASMKKALKANAEITNFVDPCVTVAFAGMQAKTNVIGNCANPEWNEHITFCEMFPTFSQSIRIHVRDAHQGVISTVLLDFNVISDNSIEDGYAPTFGPSYVNLYGSFRGNIEPSPMNFALSEGVAYRGRLLLSVEVKELQDEKKKVILHKVDKKSSKFGPEGFNDTKEKFFLFCCILEACMLDKRLDGRYVHFELSIGKYGTTEYSNECAKSHHSRRRKSTSKVTTESEDDAEDDTPLISTSASSSLNPYETVVTDEDGCRWRSCTTPAVAVADDHYSSIPYGVNKPCMFVTSQWEDYTYRYLHVNQLSHVTNTFERKLADVERALEMGLDSEARRRLRGASDNLMSTFSEYVSYLESVLFQEDAWHTELDKKKSRQRKIKIEQITKWCSDFRLRVMNPENDLKVLLEEAVNQFQTVKILSLEAQEVMPDIFLWLICGNRRVAYRRFKPYDLFYSTHRQERGVNCGKVQSFFLKIPGSGAREEVEQFSIWGHVTAYLWLGPMADREKYLDGLPKACKTASTGSLNVDYSTPPNLHYKEMHTYELRCHIYQGRSLMASDENGLSDPFVRVILGGQVKQTQIIEQSVNPIWDELLIMPKVELLGSTRFVKENPPTIILQVYDYDENSPYEFIGLAEAQPVVKLAHEPYAAPNFPPKLRWYPLYKSNHRVGEILAAFEIQQLHKEMVDYRPPPVAETTEAGPIVPVPVNIRPKLSKYQLQVLFWGIRDLATAGLFKKVKPVIEIECAGMVLESDPIDDYSKHENFSTLIKVMDVDLPDEPVYQPPVIIRCVEKKTFGRSTLLGSTTIPSLSALVQRDEEDEEEASEVDLQYEDDESAHGNTAASEAEDRAEKQSIMSYQESLLAASEVNRSQDNLLADMGEGSRLATVDETAGTAQAGSPSTLGSLGTQPRPSSGGVDDEAFEEDSMCGESAAGLVSREEMIATAASERKSLTFAAAVDGKPAASGKQMEEGRMQGRLRPRKKPDLALDWWSKYYASIQLEEQKASRRDKLKDYSQQAFKNIKKKAKKLAKKFAETNGENEQTKKKRKKLYQRRAEAAEDDPMELHKRMDLAKLKLYRHELEQQQEFDHFRDCFNVYPLYRGKKTFVDFDDSSRIVAKFKGGLRVFKHPVPADMPSPFPDIVNSRQEVIVRVYIIRAHSLMAQDFSGLADPYLVVSLGNKKISDRSYKIFGQLNPTFGRMFEFNACLPEDYELLVQVWDWDRITKDDMIGETKIDIEQRFYSKHRATCGLPAKYDENGYNAWRDCEKPTQILRDICRQYSLPQPVYLSDSVAIGDKTFVAQARGRGKLVKRENTPIKKNGKEKNDTIEKKPPEFDKEDLALMALHNVQHLPGVGHRLVPEHVETRTLYLPGKPGLTQGTLEMWVDMFPKDAVHIPEAIDIKPRKKKCYELRVVVYDTKDVILDDYNILTGLSTVDQYVKGFIAGPDIDGQETDTHYRSLNGEGNFNWRFVFRFEYSDIDNKIIYKARNSPLSLTVHEEKIPPALHLQVWDADEITSDDYLGEIVFNLTKIPRGAKSAGACNSKILKNAETINLLSKNSRRIRAWWPFVRREDDGAELLAGKVDLSFELLTEEEADRKPAGKGHEAPDPLPEPVRPETSFAWFTSPLKFLKYTVWLGMRWRLLLCFLIFLLMIFVLVFIYELPRAGAGKLVGFNTG